MAHVYHLLQTFLLILVLIFPVPATIPFVSPEKGVVYQSGALDFVTRYPIVPLLSHSNPLEALASAAGIEADAFGKINPVDGATEQPITPTLSWGDSTDATGYAYCFDTSGNNECDNAWITTTNSVTAVVLSVLDANTTYYWQVQASNGITVEADSGAWYSFTTGTPPGSFTKTSPTDGATGQPISPTLVWSDSAAATNYQYCYDQSDDGSCDTGWLTTTGSITGVVLGILASNTTYYWQVRAINAISSTEADDGSWYSFTTGIAPGAFGKTSPSNGATGQPITPTLSWASSPAATSYQYCYDTSNNSSCDGAWVSTGSNVGVSLSVLISNTTYYWQVRAFNTISSTEANGGNWYSFTTGIAPGVFGKTNPSNGAAGQPITPTLSWNSSPAATSYQYCYDTSNNSSCDGAWVSTGSISVVLSVLISNTTYYWQVRANNAISSTEADGGSWYSFTTGIAPGVFGKTNPTNGAIEQPITPTLSWSISPAATSYRYCYDTSDDGACDNSWVVTSSTTVALSALDYNKRYYWQVWAINTVSSTEADSGNWFSFTTQPLTPTAPSNLTQTNATRTTVTLSWQDNSSNEDGFMILRWNGFIYADWDAVGANVISYVVTDLPCGSVYSYKIIAFNSHGRSTATNRLDATTSSCVSVYLPMVKK
jgi:hypothetical protein